MFNNINMKYKIINLDWDITKDNKKDKFSSSTFAWIKESNEFEPSVDY